MTYTIYEKAQYSKYDRLPYTIIPEVTRFPTISSRAPIRRYRQPPKQIPLILPKPSFMPSYLVRTSDMKIVKGSEVHQGYCALSYSWNQSGEIIKDETGKKSYRRIDEGKHKIVFPARSVQKKPRGRKRIPRKVKFVKFEGLIQEICKDFNVKYIWYDQMCINQGDPEEKHHEIQQMHKIYSNAYCTISLVPELEAMIEEAFDEILPPTVRINRVALKSSQWMKRMWTLEETVMSSKMILLGRNLHIWSHLLEKSDYPIFQRQVNCDVASILYYAHARTSTKEHDRIFALANIFPNIMKEIVINYKHDIQDSMIQFYGLLAKKDLSILCFGPHTYKGYETICKMPLDDGTKNNNRKGIGYEVPIQKFDLPSWTGIYGEHIYDRGYKTPFKNYTIIGRTLQVTCSGMTSHQHTETLALPTLTIHDIPPLPQNKRTFGMFGWRLVLIVQPPGSANGKPIGISGLVRTEEGIRKAQADIFRDLSTLSHFMVIKKENLQWINSEWNLSIPYIHFSDRTEMLEDFAQYVLLIGIQFTDRQYGYSHSPVIKKSGNYYKAIGLCRIGGDDQFWHDISPEEQTFEIH